MKKRRIWAEDELKLEISKALSREIRGIPFFSEVAMEFHKVLYIREFASVQTFHIELKEAKPDFPWIVHAIVEFEAWRDMSCYVCYVWTLAGANTRSTECLSRLFGRRIQFNELFYAEQKERGERAAKNKFHHDALLKKLGKEGYDAYMLSLLDGLGASDDL